MTDLQEVYLDAPSTGSWQKFTSEYMPSTVTAAQYTAPNGSIQLTQMADTVRACTFSPSLNYNLELTQQNIGASGYPASLGQTVAWAVNLTATFNFPAAVSDSSIALCVFNGIAAGDFGYGIMFQGQNGASTQPPYFLAEKFTVNTPVGNAASGASQYNYEGTNWALGTGRIHFRLVNDGYTLHFQYSSAGSLWLDMYSLPTPNGFTHYGFTLGSFASGGPMFCQADIASNNLSIPTQYTVTAATGNGVPIVLTVNHVAGTPSTAIQVGDLVSVSGMVGNTAANSPSSAQTGSFGAVWMVVAVTTTSGLTTSLTLGSCSPTLLLGNGAWSSGGTVTLMSR